MNKIIEEIKNGKIIIFPTDTVYGIGCIPNKKSVQKIYEIKKRDFSKKIIALISNYEVLKEIVDTDFKENKNIFNIIKKYFPGELTIIFKGKKEFLNKFDESMDTIGVRMPKNKIALEIIEAAGGVLLTTSANISGEQACKNIEDIDDRLKKEVDFVINGSEKLTGVPSTIIKYDEMGQISLLREGNIRFEEILDEMKG